MFSEKIIAMKKIVLAILALVMSLNVFSQTDTFKVKDDSFHKIEGCITIPARYDDNDAAMAVVKIIPENINEQDRAKLYFEGNLATFIEVEQNIGETWVYLTAETATFLRIKHPDFGATEFWFPMSLKPKQCYEMVLQNVDITPVAEVGFLAISSEPSEADVYVDGKHYGKTTTVVTDLAEGNHTLKLEKQGYLTVTKNIVITKGETFKLNETLQTVSSQRTYLIVKADQPDARIYIDDNLKNTGEHAESVIIGSTHTYKIECNLYHTETGTVTVNERMTIEKKLRPAFGYINVSTTPEQGAKVFVNGEYLGLSPIKSDKLKSGSHTVMVMKDMFKMTEKSFTVNDGQTTNANIEMSVNFVIITINTDEESDIYVDEELKGKGSWTGRLSEGSHYLEARKPSHKTIAKNINLIIGENETITLEAPKPIYGFLDINTTPIMAEIYIDGEHYGQTPSVINDLLVGEHELRLEKEGYSFFMKNITIENGKTLELNETLEIGKEVKIITDISGDSIYVDGFYAGISPIEMMVSYGLHDFKAIRNTKTLKQSITITESSENVRLMFNEINGHEYVDLGLSVKWATCNVGASKPEDYGDYFAWGETSTKSTYSEGNSKTTGEQMNDIKGNSQYDAARANWGGSWRLPTKKELEELENKCIWTWTTQNGVKGYKVTGPNGKSIFLPAAGHRGESSLYRVGEGGSYWTSTSDSDNYFFYEYFFYFFDYGEGASCLFFDSGRQYVDLGDRYYGGSVRPVSE